jgi:hypothetical protein
MDTSIFSDLNWIAVLLGGLGYFLLGALWYSKVLFAPAWIRLCKIDVNDPKVKQGVALIMITSVLWMMLTALGLAILRERLAIHGWQSGMKLGLLTGILFGASSISISYLYERRPMGLYFINGGYTILGHIIAATIICAWS